MAVIGTKVSVEVGHLAFCEHSVRMKCIKNVHTADALVWGQREKSDAGQDDIRRSHELDGNGHPISSGVRGPTCIVRGAPLRTQPVSGSMAS